MSDLTRCPMCGSRRIGRVRETVRFGKRAPKLVVPDLSFERCRACGEAFFDAEANRIIDRHRPRRRATAAR